MAYNPPTGDFVTTSLNGVMAAGATSGTIGTGLPLPATNGILEISYDTANAIGVTDGPETISYATYNSGTGALTGIVKGLAGTIDVQHSNGQSVSSSVSSLLLSTAQLYGLLFPAWTSWTPVFTGFSAPPTVGYSNYIQIGKIVICGMNVSATGASNSATKTITLPVAAKASVAIPIRGYDNGALLSDPSYLTTTAGSATANVFKDVQGDNWTNPGNCYFDFGQLVYEAN